MAPPLAKGGQAGRLSVRLGFVVRPGAGTSSPSGRRLGRRRFCRERRWGRASTQEQELFDLEWVGAAEVDQTGRPAPTQKDSGNTDPYIHEIRIRISMKCGSAK